MGEVILESLHGHATLIGTEVSGAIHTALEQAIKISEGGGLVAPSWLLADKFKDICNTVADSDEITGIDTAGAHAGKNEPVILTIHGGCDGNTLITPDIIKRANQLFRKSGQQFPDGKGFTRDYGLCLDSLFEGIDVIGEILSRGRMPDGTKIPVYTFEELRDGKSPQDFSRFAVARTMKELYRHNTHAEHLVEKDLKGQVSVVNPQLLVFANGAERAARFAETIDFFVGQGQIVSPYPLIAQYYQWDVPQAFKNGMHWGCIDLKSLHHSPYPCNYIGITAEEIQTRKELGPKPTLEQVAARYKGRESKHYTPRSEIRPTSLGLGARYSC